MSTTSSPHASPTDLPLRRFSVEEYRRLGEAGILSEADRVELLAGHIVEKMNLNPPHSVSVKLCDQALSAAISDGWHTRVQDAITTSDSEPEPDIAVVRGEIRDFARRHPTAKQVALVVEVADTSLARDHYKRTIYARAGIAVFWIVNLRDRLVEVYQDPTGTEETATYKHEQTYREDQQVPLVIEGTQVALITAGDLMS